MLSSWNAELQVGAYSIRRVNSHALGVYDGMEVMIRAFYTPSVIGSSRKEPRYANLLTPGTPGLWMQKRRENVCSAGDQTPVVCTHTQLVYWQSYSGAMLHEDTIKQGEIARVTRVTEYY
jgi:hypothetical protein